MRPTLASVSVACALADHPHECEAWKCGHMPRLLEGCRILYLNLATILDQGCPAQRDCREGAIQPRTWMRPWPPALQKRIPIAGEVSVPTSGAGFRYDKARSDAGLALCCVRGRVADTSPNGRLTAAARYTRPTPAFTSNRRRYPSRSRHGRPGRRSKACRTAGRSALPLEPPSA